MPASMSRVQMQRNFDMLHVACNFRTFNLIRDNATESRHSMYLCSVLLVKNPSLLLIVVDLMLDYLSYMKAKGVGSQ